MWLKFHQIRRYLIFQGSRRPLLGVLAIIEKSWNYGILPYLVANTSGFNFTKIGGIWIFLFFGGGEKPPIRGCYMWPAMPIFELGRAIPVKSHVWKFGSDSLSLSRVIIWIFRGGRNPLLGGYMWPVMPLFELARAIQVKSHVWKFGSDWLSLSRAIVSTNIFPGGRNPLLGWGLHLACGAHFWTRMSYTSQKSYVKIWFGLAEIVGMLSLREAEDPLLREGLHVTYDAHFRTWLRFSR